MEFHVLFKVTHFIQVIILYLTVKAKRSVSVLKEQANAAANQAKACAASAGGSNKAKAGKNSDGRGAKDPKDPAKKVCRVVMVRRDDF